MALNIPSIPSTVDPAVRRAIQAIKEHLYQPAPRINQTPEGFSAPPRPEDFYALAMVPSVLLTWDDPRFDLYAHAEIWRGTADDLELAVMIGTATGFSYFDASIPEGEDVADYFYWVRFVSSNGVKGPFNETRGTAPVVLGLYADIVAAMGIVSGIASDGLLSVVEKRQWLDTWNNYVAEASAILAQAQAAGLCVVEGDDPSNAQEYNDWYLAGVALYNYMAPMWADMESPSTINDDPAMPTEFQDRWGLYLTTRQVLLDAIAQSYGLTPEQQADVAAAMQLVNDVASDSVFSAAEKAYYYTAIETAFLEYPEILSRATTLGLTSHATYTTFVADSEALATYLATVADWDDITVSSTIDPTTFNTLWNSYFVSRQKLLNQISVEDARRADFSQINDDNGGLAQLNADVAAANAIVAGLVDDGVITSVEKRGIVPSWQSVVNDYIQVHDTSTTLGISTTAFDAAAAAVHAAMKPIFGVDGSDVIDYHLLDEDYSLTDNSKTRAWFTGLWATYWDEWAALKATIETTAATTATWANVADKPTSLADLDPAVSSAITDLQAQTDNKLAVFVQATTPSWTDANANHTGDSWYNTSDLKWYKYNGTSWAVQDSSIYNLNDLASSKTTIHYASGTSTPSTALGVVGDFCLYKNTTTGVMTFYKKTGTTTWTAQPGSYVDGADVTALNTAYDTARVNGSLASTVAANAAAGATFTSATAGDLAYLDTANYSTYITGGPPVNADNTETKLATAGALTLKGTLTPQDSGALKVGSILWNTTSGAYSSGTGIAITEAGIIGANSAGISFSIDTSGNVIFKGDLYAGSTSGVNLKMLQSEGEFKLYNTSNLLCTIGKKVSTLGFDFATLWVKGHDSSSCAIEAEATNTAIYGKSSASNGVVGVTESTTSSGVHGIISGGSYSSTQLNLNGGVRGMAESGDAGVVGCGGDALPGVYGMSESSDILDSGIVGYNPNKVGGRFQGGSGVGKWGGIGANTASYPTEITTTYGGGVAGYSSETSTTSFGVFGKGRNGVGAISSISGGAGVIAAHTLTSGVNYGVYSKCDSPSGYDFYAAGAGLDGPFTGAHDSVVLAGSCEPGDILVDVQLLNAASVVNTLCLQEKSSVKRQKTVVGVYVAGERIVSLPEQEEDGSVIDGTTEKIVTQLQAAETFDDFLEIVRGSNFPAGLNERFRDTPTDDTFGQYRDLLVSLIQTHEWARMASLGEGMINVVAEGGNIEAGDYICSSSTPGKGMRQDDDLLHNYTVAKAREDVVWTAEEVAANAVKMIACTYHCG